MESHKRLAGTLFIVFAVLQIIGMLFLSFFVTWLLQLIFSEVEMEAQWVATWLIPLLQAIAWGSILIFAIPSIIAGVGLINDKKWALTLALVLGCFKLFSVPFGTALGIYTIWIYLEENKKSTFVNQPPA
jgi:hypothetical protein